MAMGGPPLSRDGCPGHGPPVTPEIYRFEEERRRSFRGWALNSVINPKHLSRVGFVYTGVGTKVQCFQCGVTCSDWHKGDIPLNVHQRANPSCHFLQTLSCKRKSPRSEMVLSTNHVPLLQWEADEVACVSNNLQLFRGLMLLSSNAVQAGVKSFQGYHIIDHRPEREIVPKDANTIRSSSSDLMMTPLHPSPAHMLPVQSTQATDDSAVLIRDALKPTPDCFGCYTTVVDKDALRTTGTANAPSNTFDDNELNSEKIRVNICKLCYMTEVECIFLPCGHAGTCRSCATHWQQRSSFCPFCREVVENIHKAYFP